MVHSHLQHWTTESSVTNDYNMQTCRQHTSCGGQREGSTDAYVLNRRERRAAMHMCMYMLCTTSSDTEAEFRKWRAHLEVGAHVVVFHVSAITG